MIGTILAILCGALLLLPQAFIPYLAYTTGQTGLGFFLHSYQLITYSLLHANLPHYAYNMLWLVPSCWYLEERVGKKALGVFCVAASVASALCFQMAQALSMAHLLASMLGAPDQQCLLGASGVATGTVTAALMVLAETEERYSVVAYLLLAGLLVCSLGDALMAQVSQVQIAYWGHMGGMFMAFFFAPRLTLLATSKAR